ncbi:MAG: SRPBCC family protein [Planctomycetes bacterium]|nr:SRPBCC family protein [Planctomycetota bacterium]
MKKIVIGLIVLIGLILLGGYLLPSDYEVSRSVVIQSDEATIYPMIANLKRWQDWSPWTKERYEDMKSEYTGPEVGKDSKWSWTGDSSGNGSLLITDADPKSGIAYDLRFEDYPVSKCHLSLKRVDNGVEVTMTNAGSMGSAPWARYFGLMMDSAMGAEFEKGLGNLKSLAEKKSG